jgi:hypothetical protein
LKLGPAAAPAAQGKCETCPFCANTFPPGANADWLNPKSKGSKSSWKSDSEEPNSEQAFYASEAKASPGKHGNIAASVLMKILYAARVYRFDLLRPVCTLARRITSWSADCDDRLLRLISYIHSTTEHVLVGWVGDSEKDIDLHLFADADLAGCKITQRSTSGAHLALRGPSTCFPLSANAKRQDSVSHSTPEAEIVAVAFGLRTEGMAVLDLLETISDKPVALRRTIRP